MRTNKSSFYTMWSLAIVLCVLLSVFALFFASCAKSDGTRERGEDKTLTVNNEPEPTPEPEQPADPEQSVEPEQNVDGPDEPEPAPEPVSGARLAETADAGAGYLDKLIFLGDSTTYGLKAYEVLSGGAQTTQVWTPANGTLTLSNQSIATIVYPETGEEIPITDAVERKKPEYMVLTLGVNGVSFMDEENFVREYTDLVKRIQETSPDTKIILNSIYPVAATYEHQKDINNDKIRAANVWIEQVAENTGVRFLNTFEVLVGPDGYLPEAYHNGDGIHMNTTGFNIILDYIKTHEYK